MASRQTSIRINDELQPIMDKYMSIWGDESTGSGRQSWAIFEAFKRLDTQYRIDQRLLRELFADGERNLMLNNALSTKYDSASIPGAVLADTQDEDPAQFEYYGADRGVLIEKLKVLTIGQQFALVAWLEELRAKAKE
jgi:hypothetical protein